MRSLFRTRQGGARPFLLLLLMPAAVSGFSKDEHEQLSYFSFEALYSEYCAVSSGHPACDALEDAAALASVTRAADYFTHIERMVPDLESCAAGIEKECRARVIEKCAKPASREACAIAATNDTLQRVQRRRNKKLLRALAVHRNEEHFREGARDTYEQMHERAIEAAKQGRWKLALYAEAVALHFLQDAFAPGHLASPRALYVDALAGALHDRFNRDGLDFRVSPSLCATTEGVVEQLSTGTIEPIDLDLPPAKLIKPAALVDDLREFARSVCRDGRRYTSYGDKHLLMGNVANRKAEPHRSRSFHRVSMLLVSRLSVEEVLHPQRSASSRICYQPPSKPHVPDTTVRQRMMSTDPGFWAPALAFGTEAQPPCWSDATRSFLIEYATDALDDQHPLREETPTIWAYQAAFSTWGELRRRFELSFDVLATQAFVRRTEDNRFDDDPNPNGRLGTISFSLHHESIDELDVYGAGVLYGWSYKFGEHRDFDAYVGLEPGLGSFRHPLDTTTRFRWSARIGIGISIAAVEALYENGYEYGPTGFERDERWSMNFRLRFSHTWLRGAPK